ncbi:Peptidase S24-like protein [Fusobacterium necrophorum subsp. funduliforme]|uniref:LexA family protein n=1 Tax=Fusobacterium necrophorum TaxID=859 RepID=UPI00370EA017
MKEKKLSETIGDKILKLRKETGLTQEQFSKIAGVTPLSILKYESGERLISIDTLLNIANYFKIPISYFLGENILKVDENMIKIPVVSVVSAGNGKCGLDDITDWIEFSENIFPACDFATTVSGDSMEPKIFDSDILLIRKSEVLNSGDIGIFKIDEDVFCKKLQLNHLTNEVILKSLNPCYAPRYLSKEELENFKIIGKVVGKLDYHF